jgi:hypothetical protein
MSSYANLRAVAFLAAVVSCDMVCAQSASAPRLRYDVKLETRNAEKAGQLVPPGQGPSFSVPRTSEKTRAQRKAETLAARNAGTLAKPGEGETQKADRDLRAAPTTVDRAERKAQTRAAERAGSLIPAGEGIPRR